MRLRVLLPMLILVVASSAAFAFPPIPPAKDKKAKEEKLSLKSLDGTWTVTTYEYHNARGVMRTTTYTKVEIKNGQWKQYINSRGNEVLSGTYSFTIDAAKGPPHFDLALSAAKNAKASRLGVFRLEDDRLTVTYTLNGKDRPTSAEGPMVVSQYRWVLKRDKR